jgi:hypothetical protein
MNPKLLSSLVAVAFGFALNAAVAQNADLQEPPTDGQQTKTLPEATESQDDVAQASSTDDAAKNQSDIPDQSQGAVGHPEQEQATGQGQGVKEQNAGESK